MAESRRLRGLGSAGIEFTADSSGPDQDRRQHGFSRLANISEEVEANSDSMSSTEAYHFFSERERRSIVANSTGTWSDRDDRNDSFNIAVDRSNLINTNANANFDYDSNVNMGNIANHPPMIPAYQSRLGPRLNQSCPASVHTSSIAIRAEAVANTPQRPAATFQHHRPKTITRSYPPTGSGVGWDAFLTYKPTHNQTHDKTHFATGTSNSRTGIGRRIASPATNPFPSHQAGDVTRQETNWTNKQSSERESGVGMGFEAGTGSGLKLNHSWETDDSRPRTIDPRWVSPHSSLLTTPATSRRPSPAPPDRVVISNTIPDWDSNYHTHLRQHLRPNQMDAERTDLADYPLELTSHPRLPFSLPISSAQGLADFDPSIQVLDLRSLSQIDPSNENARAWSGLVDGEGFGDERVWGISG